jgi:hypothetical protein
MTGDLEPREVLRGELVDATSLAFQLAGLRRAYVDMLDTIAQRMKEPPR